MDHGGSSPGVPPGGKPVLRAFTYGILVRVRSTSEIAEETLLPIEQVRSTLDDLDERGLVTEIAPDRYAITDDGLDVLGAEVGSER